jgi:hypothetical protein
MRIGTSSRSLTPKEQALATRVFGPTLMPWNRILIDNGLGLGDAPYTLEGPPKMVMLHMGPVGFPDCASKEEWDGYGAIDAVFIHEMTHAWQYDKGYNVVASSLWGRSVGAGYHFVLGDPWDDYNVEQQASIVEKWYAKGMDPSHAAFPYIDKVIRRSGANKSKSLADLANIT